MPRKKKQSTNKGKALLYSLVALVLFTATAGQVDLSKVDWSDLSTLIEMFDTEKPIDYGELEELPDYDGEHSIVTINNNRPTFTADDLKGGKTWQTFQPLDSLNRVGQANALLHRSMAPKTERGDISNVYPTGWKQKKLPDGKWLYNRSHLIAFRLTGENDNWQNLFTGTQQMNQLAMTKYEEQVATYLKETSNHVRYRVTPYFREAELVPRGVQMEAQSIEDPDWHFNVFIYNVQDGYTINYETGSSTKVKK
ncbi:DNA/RNA non-specific endonuclease [Candidatus Enterococcus willemsii]|uniref:DNA-entry nuclease n=1 Tax=Candidatus Enterococcus willemsii TaxID=1857215 RepID=A0ABQ6YVH9_9ENTE|nr:DNA/RNA non-specific endonuclease [Enterococcus sp. CU12B]KAF1301098.1 DNA-entry nuclease [Enterococcus sp. CU12B]